MQPYAAKILGIVSNRDRLFIPPSKTKVEKGDLSGSPVVKTPCFQCGGFRFDPLSESKDPTCLVAKKNQSIKQKQYCNKQ